MVGTPYGRGGLGLSARGQLLSLDRGLWKGPGFDGWVEEYGPAARTGWAGEKRVNPNLVPGLEGALPYYWTAHQTEWATDVAFRSAPALAAVYPQLALGAITGFSSEDVLRFLQRRHTQNLTGDVASDFKDRAEGLRVKHAANGNAVKMYDKQGSILRVETTITQSRDPKVYRASERQPDGEKSLRRMRRGVVDLPARADKSQRTNERYLDGLAQLDSTARLEDIFGSVSKPKSTGATKVRALRL